MKNRIECGLPVPAAIAERIEQDEEGNTMSAIQDRLQSGKRRLTELIVARPGTGVAVAAVAGFALGWMLKRK